MNKQPAIIYNRKASRCSKQTALFGDEISSFIVYVNLTSFAYCLESYSWEAKPSVQKSHTNYSNMFQTFALNTKVKKCNKNSVIPWKFCFCRPPKNSTFLSSICLCWPTFAHRTFKTSNPTQLTFLMIYNDAAVFFVTYCCQNLFRPLKINNHSLSICLV